MRISVHIVALILGLFSILGLPSRLRAQPATTAPSTLPSTQPAFEQVGTIDSPLIPESSGIVESRKYPGVFWTHNDSGNPAEVFAISRDGKLINRFAIRATNIDWEDIAIDDAGHLYLADIGNNEHKRTVVQVYRIAEPDPRVRGNSILPDQVFQLTFPGAPFDAESLFFLGDSGFIISKHRDLALAGVYQFDLKRSTVRQALVKVTDLPIRTPVTAADVSRDGRLLAIMTVVGPSVFRIDGDVRNVSRGPIWSGACFDLSMEGVCFVSGGLLATTEGRRVLFFPFDDKPATTHPAR